MATLAQIQTYAVGNPELRQRFLAARLQVAWNVLKEAIETPNHVERLAWAKQVLANYENNVALEYNWTLSHGNVQNGTAIASTPTGDTALIAAVSSFVDSWAV